MKHRGGCIDLMAISWQETGGPKGANIPCKRLRVPLKGGNRSGPSQGRQSYIAWAERNVSMAQEEQSSILQPAALRSTQELGRRGGGTSVIMSMRRPPQPAKPKSWLRRMGSAGQRSLHSIQAHFPTTASSAQFCLLCYQPEPVPRSLAARLSQLTSRDPCRLQAW